MEHITLGTSDLKVSPVCVGCWQFNGGVQTADKTHSPQTEHMSMQIVDKAIELGVNFFDTAEAYPNSEVVLGKILEGRRKNVVVASKFAGGWINNSALEIEKALTQSLLNLKTDYIDLYQVHWPQNVAGNMKGCVEELERLKAKGQIREYAVCNFGPQNMKDFFAAGGKPVTNQVAYNLLWRAVEYEIAPWCKEHSVGILPYSPLQQGLLTGRYLTSGDVPEGRRRGRLFNASSCSLQRHGGAGAEKEVFQAIGKVKEICEKADIPMSVASLSWLLQQDPVASVVVGASSPEQVAVNVKTVTLHQDVLKQLSDATEEVKGFVGANADMWAAESRIA